MNYNYYFFFTVTENNTIFIIKITSKICLSYIKLIKTQAISSSPSTTFLINVAHHKLGKF